MQVVTGIRLRWLSPRAISNLFLASDIFCFLIQSSGAGIMTSDYNMGINLLLAGLALQLGFFVLFVILLALHVPRIYIYTTPVTCQRHAALQPQRAQQWRTAPLRTLAASLCSGCCMAPWPCWAFRNVYRFAEFVQQGFDG